MTQETSEFLKHAMFCCLFSFLCYQADLSNCNQTFLEEKRLPGFKICNVVQTIVGKFTNSKKIGFSTENFRAGLLQFSGATVENLSMSGWSDTCLSLKVPQ